MSRGKLKLDANDLLNIMQALAAYKNIFVNAYSAEEDRAVKFGLGERMEELQDLFRRVHNIRLKMEEQARRDETEAPPPGSPPGEGKNQMPGEQKDNQTIGDNQC